MPKENRESDKTPHLLTLCDELKFRTSRTMCGVSNNRIK